MEKSIMVFDEKELTTLLLACRRSYERIANARKNFDKYPSYRDTLIANADREQQMLVKLMRRFSHILEDIQND